MPTRNLREESAKDSSESPGSKPTAFQSACVEHAPHSSPKIAKYCSFLLLYNLAVVAWGGFVRASFSGAGCGDHWPLCGGQLLPAFASFQQIAEFSHRMSSGLVLPMVGILAYLVFNEFPVGHQARKGAFFSVVFTVTEALIGAILVLFKLVAHNESVTRTVSMSMHLVNTFILLSAIIITYLAVSGTPRIRWKGQGSVGWALGVAFGSVMLVGVSGACSALGHMLRPTEDVLGAALAAGSNYLIKLQALHPLIATSVGLYLVLITGLLNHLRPDAKVKKALQYALSIYGLQIALGLVNIALKAPVWMQMIHLVLADCLWIAVVFAAAYAMRDGVSRVETVHPGAQPLGEIEHSRGMAMVKQYVALTKPRVISLLLFTTLATMFIAAKGWPGGWLFLAVAIGGYMAAGAANAINMVIDRDIDGTMKRTSKRPTVTQDISSNHALGFGFTLAALSFGILWLSANLLTAVMALSGLVFYVVIYTLLLKRRTWQNIVIGGAAGAFPPLVGWAAVTNTLPVMAWWLFAVIFLWTPVHFWALALLIKDDYAAAGVPMLPVVKGDRNTVLQIGIYAILTVLLTVVPFLQGELGKLYLVSWVLLSTYLLVLCLNLFKTVERPQASKLFHYSMLYLAILFLMVAIDRAVPL